MACAFFDGFRPGLQPEDQGGLLAIIKVQIGKKKGVSLCDIFGAFPAISMCP